MAMSSEILASEVKGGKESEVRLDVEERVAAMLQTLRRSRVDLPTPDLLERTPISMPAESEFDATAEALGRSFPAGVMLAFDLDDTLLNVSYTCGEDWVPLPDRAMPPADSIQYHRMRRSPWRVLKYGWRLPQRFQYSPQRYPFLRNPQVFVQIRPGLVAALRGLKAAGVRLALVTASARARVEFLLVRLPQLRELFVEGDRLLVAAAEDLLRVSSDLYLQPECYSARSELDTLSLAVHACRPLSLAMKTPWALRQILDAGDYDLLIDDSATTAAHMRANGLGRKVLEIDARQPQTDYVIDILQAARRQLECGLDLHSARSIASAPVARESAGNRQTGYDPATYPHLRLEDPLYYPLIHLSDRVEARYV
ncbi:MAG: hypothetical protein AAGB13_00505 [Cyanobacteria bacterium P01_F01_bin.33]